MGTCACFKKQVPDDQVERSTEEVQVAIKSQAVQPDNSEMRMVESDVHRYPRYELNGGREVHL